jgi:hypothetical protein
VRENEIASQRAVPPSAERMPREEETEPRSRVTERTRRGWVSKSTSKARSRRSERPPSSSEATASCTLGSFRNMLAEESMASATVSGRSPAFSKLAISWSRPSSRMWKASRESPLTGLPALSVTTTKSSTSRTSTLSPRPEALTVTASSAVEPSSRRAVTRRYPERSRGTTIRCRKGGV